MLIEIKDLADFVSGILFTQNEAYAYLTYLRPRQITPRPESTL
jgi:hypothetical protein